MNVNGGSNRYEEIPDDESLDSDPTESGFETDISDQVPDAPSETPNPELPGPDVLLRQEGEVAVTHETPKPETEEMVTIRNLTKGDVPVLICDLDGKSDEQVTIKRLSVFGPIERSRLSPQVFQLETNRHVRIEVTT